MCSAGAKISSMLLKLGNATIAFFFAKNGPVIAALLAEIC